MKQKIHPIDRPDTRALNMTALASALLLATFHLPAVAGDVCRHADDSADSTAVGIEAFACGYGNTASGMESMAFGNSNIADDTGSLAFGSFNESHSLNSSAFGWGNTASHVVSSAFGAQNTSSGFGSSAFGSQNTASADRSAAFGADNTASGNYSMAFGSWNTASGLRSSAIGYRGTASGARSLVVAAFYDRDGNGATTLDIDIPGDGIAGPVASSETAYAGSTSSVAMGAGVVTYGAFSSAVGVGNTANGESEAAMGFNNITGSNNSFSFSGNNAAMGINNLATGGSTLSFGGPTPSSAALGAGNQAKGGNSSALGVANIATGANSTAIGYSSVASANDSTAIGSSSVADRVNTISVGAVGTERQIVNVAVGTADTDAVNVAQLNDAISGISAATSPYFMADGANDGSDDAVVTAASSVAIGANSVADRGNSISVGSAGAERQIVNVADATQQTDAVNLRQLGVVGSALATTLGGGAGWDPLTSSFTAPSYVIQGSNFNNVGAAFAAVNGQLSTLYSAIGGIETTPGPPGPAGPMGPQGPEGPAGPGNPLSVAYDGETRDVMTLEGANGTRIANVADAVETTDAVNLGQMQLSDSATLVAAQNYADAGDTETLVSANDYTDSTATETLSAANTYTDQRFAEITGLSDSFETFRNETDRRFQQQDRRIDKLSAMSGAYAGMAMNTSGLAGRNRVGVGVGAQGGEQALAVGYRRAIGNRASVSIAGAFSGDETSVSAGAGLSW